MAKLPSFEDMLLASKKRKGVVSGLKSAIATLAGTDLLELDDASWEKLSQGEILCWMYARYDHTTVDIIRNLHCSQNTVLSVQWLKFVSEMLGMDQQCLSKVCYHLHPKTESNPLILCPPVSMCYDCGNDLVKNHRTAIKVYTLQGYQSAVKYSLRCKSCNIYYNYCSFGNKHELGFRFYPVERKYVEASDIVYFDRNVLQLQCSFANHSWVSFQGFAEAYNDTFLLLAEQEISPHTVGEMFYNGELEDELRRIGRTDYRFKLDSDRESCMKMIDERRRVINYDHPIAHCASNCRSRGCGKLWVTDGIWKTVFPHCMFKMKQTSFDFPTLNLPDVCTSMPLRGKAFCSEHCSLLSEQAPTIPLDLKNFLKYCGISSESDDICEKVDSTVDGLAITQNTVGESAIESQEEPSPSPEQHSEICGSKLMMKWKVLNTINVSTSKLLEEQPFLVEKSDLESTVLCKKDTGTGHKLRKWSRGHQFVVRGGGHIDTWQPLYKSESPSQVFFILIQWLLNTSKTGILPQDIILAYDNMCNLDRLKISRVPLPFDPPLNRLWLDVVKIIDVFHFKNHVSEDCKTKYSPAKVKEENPNFNTQAGEQTFIWVGKFKSILCSMNKTHHLFYLHRMVLRRNKYTSKCYLHGRKPLLPKK